jgi:mRNA interferase MazF
MARILRGEVRWAELNPVRGHEQAGRRPVLVLSHDVFNDRSGTVIAVALTSQEPRAGFPLTLESWTRRSETRPVGRSESDPLEGGSFYALLI